MVASHGPETAARMAQIDAVLAEYSDLLDAASDQVRVRLHELAVRCLPPGLGLGLGLYIVAGLVSAHEGVVHVETSPAGGARIRVVLPHGLPDMLA